MSAPLPPKRRAEALRRLAQASPEAAHIARAELDAGNAISGFSLAWPEAGNVFVSFERPFVGAYAGPFSYSETQSPHYREWVGRCYTFRGGVFLASPQ